MLLDRRRVKFWQKWVFLFMAIIMGLFLIMIPLSGRISGCGGSAPSATKAADAAIVRYLAAVKTDPQSAGTWQSLAQTYMERANLEAVGSTSQTADWQAGAVAYQRAVKILAKQKGAAAKQARLTVLGELVTAYSYLNEYQLATGVYGEITTLTPQDAQAYFGMAKMAIQAGNTNTAMLAFGKYLELDPKSPYASDVKTWMKSNAPSPAPTKGSGK